MMQHLALRQGMGDEDVLDRLQVELGRQIHHRHVLVVEFAVLFGRVTVVLDQVAEEFAVRGDVPVEVHRHEA